MEGCKSGLALAERRVREDGFVAEDLQIRIVISLMVVFGWKRNIDWRGIVQRAQN